MKFHGIKMKGKFFAEVLDNLPSFTSKDKGRILYSNNSNVMFFGGLDAFSTEFSSLNDIPKDSIVLIDSSSTILGYTILDDVDDQLVYISKNVNASGGPGGQEYEGSTWTQPNHTHPFDIGHVHGLSSGIHNHTMESNHLHTVSHTHEFAIGVDFAPTSPIALGIVLDNSRTIGVPFNYDKTTGTTGNFPGVGGCNAQVSTALSISNTNNTIINMSTNDNPVSGNTNSGSAQGTTDPNASASSWRPEGRNFTRQQKL